jgi:hypothetical protein
LNLRKGVFDTLAQRPPTDAQRVAEPSSPAPSSTSSADPPLSEAKITSVSSSSPSAASRANTRPTFLSTQATMAA